MNYAVNYFKNIQNTIDRSHSNHFFMFLQYWILAKIPSEWTVYDKYVFHFRDNRLDEVRFVKDNKIVKSYNRTAWVQPVIDLDSMEDDEVDSGFSDEFLENEDTFVSKIVKHWSVTPLSDYEFIVTLTQESFSFK